MARQTEYWRARKQHDGTFVEYGNDVEGSAFSARNSRDPLGSSRWNLQARSAGAIVRIWQKPPCAGAMLCRATITARGSPHWCRPAAGPCWKETRRCCLPSAVSKPAVVQNVPSSDE